MVLRPGDEIVIKLMGADREVKLAWNRSNQLTVHFGGALVHRTPVLEIENAVTGRRVSRDAASWSPGQYRQTTSRLERRRPETCQARRERDEWACGRCGLRWSTDDTLPEACRALTD